jgi:predicted RNase H-like HicB family nuclease
VRYPAIITKERRKTLATFADCPGCETEADPGEDISIQATDALTGWLESHLLLGPSPRNRQPGSARGRCCGSKFQQSSPSNS